VAIGIHQPNVGTRRVAGLPLQRPSERSAGSLRAIRLLTVHRAIETSLDRSGSGEAEKNGVARRLEAAQNTSSFLKDFAWPVHPEKQPDG
jgi:hypothetical protein